MWLLELTVDEQTEVWQLVAQGRSALAEQFHPTGFNDGEPCLDFLSEQKIVATLGRIATDVDQFVGRAAKDVAGDEVVSALTEDSDRVFHRRRCAAIDNRVVSDSAADAVFQF